MVINTILRGYVRSLVNTIQNSTYLLKFLKVKDFKKVIDLF